MFSVQDLVGIGFSREQAVLLLKDHYFILNWKNKSFEDFRKKMIEIQKVYSVSREKAAKAVFTHPPFAGYDHSRVLREVMRLGRVVGLKKKNIVNTILQRPVLAGYSQKRNLAVIDAIRNAANQAGIKVSAKQGLELYKKTFGKSPYPVTGSKKRETWWQRKQPATTTPSKFGQAIRRTLQRKPKP